jgi:predicted nucleic acid-binding protein
LIESFYAKYVVVEVSKALLLKASVLREQYAFSFWDSTIVSSALHGGASVLYSEDMQAGLVVENRVRIINPFGNLPSTEAQSRGNSG